MKLREKEYIIKEYNFSQSNNSYSKGILTNFRLVYITKNSKDNHSEENYPLSKLTSVKVEKQRNSFRSKVLGFAVVGMMILVMVTILSVIVVGMNTILSLLPFYVILIGLIIYGLKPDKVITKLVITQLGGTKLYLVRDNKELEEFIDEINGQLI